jgi:hypothetical protein
MPISRQAFGTFTLALLIGASAACGGSTPAGDDPAPQAAASPAADRIGGVPAYTAPEEWGTNHNEKFSFRYPPEYTADLDFATREIVVTRVSDKVELIRVASFDSDDPVFRKVADEVPFYNEILGSAVKK